MRTVCSCCASYFQSVLLIYAYAYANRQEKERNTMNPENNDLLFPADDDDLLLLQDNDEEEEDFEEMEMDFEQGMDADLFDDPCIYLTIL
jgi:hypothetical protein